MNKKLLVLLWVYASWVVAALLYNKKSPTEIKTELDEANKTWQKSFKVLFNNFIEIHKNLLEDFKVKVLTEENKKLLYTKRDEFLELTEEYKVKAQKIFQEYKHLWKNYADEWLKKLKKFYNEKLDEIEDLKKKAPDKVNEAREKLLWYYNEFKAKMKK